MTCKLIEVYTVERGESKMVEKCGGGQREGRGMGKRACLWVWLGE